MVPTATTLTHALTENGLRPPRILTFAITKACNLRCRHCLVDAHDERSEAHVPGETALRVLEQFRELGGAGVRLTGGEPLCHPRGLELVARAVELGFEQVMLQTNALLLGADQVLALRRIDFPGLGLEVSLDGACAATHDLVRGEGGFERVLAVLRQLAAEGLGGRVSLFFTEMRHNLREIPELLRIAEELGVGAVLSGALVRGGRAATDAELLPPEPEQYLELWQRYRTDADFRERYRRLGRTAFIEWQRGEVPRTEPCTFVEHPYLTATGVLYPCVLCHCDPYAVTGVFNKGLADAFAEGGALWRRLMETSRSRAAESEKCRSCPRYESCGAGCMGRAWGSCGDLMAPDDRCAVRQLVPKP